MAYNLTVTNGGCQDAGVRPVSPVDFTATADDFETITLEWDDNDADYDYGTIEYSLDEATWVYLIQFVPELETYEHVGLEAETDYYYRLRTFKRTKWSAYSTADDTTPEE